MLWTLEFTGDDTTSGAYTFYVLRNMTFKTVKVHSVQVILGNDSLSQSWAYTTTGTTPNRTVYAPLYLRLSGFGHEDLLHQAGASNASTAIPIGTAQDATDPKDALRRLDYPLTDRVHHLAAGHQITVELLKRSVESAGTYGALSSLTNTEFDDGCRVVIVLELDEGAEHATNVAKAARSKVHTVTELSGGGQ